MGTNYYLEQGQCSHCGHEEEPLHIGKSSAGWVFALRVYPELGLNTLADWIRFWLRKEYHIIDEYHHLVDPKEMLEIIANRTGGTTMREAPMLSANHAVLGPNNLMRCQEGVRGVRHGEGTYDLHPKEFS